MPWQYSCGRVCSCWTEMGQAYCSFLLKYSVFPNGGTLMHNVAFEASHRSKNRLEYCSRQIRYRKGEIAMIHQATQKIADKLTEKGLNHDVQETGNLSVVSCGVRSKFITYRIQFISRDEDNDVAARVFDLTKFPEEKLADMLAFANECNGKYRYVKLVVNCKDNTLQMEYDMPLASGDVGEIALETLARIMDVMNKISEDMMRRIWA